MATLRRKQQPKSGSPPATVSCDLSVSLLGTHPAVRTAYVGYDEDHPSAPARAALDRPDPGRRCGRSRHAASHRRAAGRRPISLRGHLELAVAERQPVRVCVPKSHGPDPHRGSRHRSAKRDTQAHTQPHAERRRDYGRSDRRTDDRRPDTAADEYAAPDPRADEDALSPAQLRNDRCELAHGVARHRDVAQAEALAALQQELAQGRA